MNTRSIFMLLFLFSLVITGATSAFQFQSVVQYDRSLANQIRLPAPNLIGKTYDQARSYNETAWNIDGRRLPFFRTVNTLNPPYGTIISQLPLPNTPVAPGGIVTLTFGTASPSSITKTILNILNQTHPLRDNEVQVPPTIGKLVYSAVDILHADHLQANFDAVGTDQVIRSDPVAGTVVIKGSVVTLSGRPVTPPPQTVQVPQLVGLSLDDARSKLDTRLKLRNINHTRTQGQSGIISQDPRPYISVLSGSSIDITINQPPTQPDDISSSPSSTSTSASRPTSETHRVTVPPLIGQTIAQARETLKPNLILGFTTPDASPESARITGQNPEEGAIVDFNSSVNVTTPQSRVPDLQGMSKEAAAKAIEYQNLILAHVTGPADGTVTGQSLASGDVFPAETLVGITLSPRSSWRILLVVVAGFAIAGGLLFYFLRLIPPAARPVHYLLRPIPTGMLTVQLAHRLTAPNVEVNISFSATLVLTLHDVRTSPRYDLAKQPSLSHKSSFLNEQP